MQNIRKKQSVLSKQYTIFNLVYKFMYIFSFFFKVKNTHNTATRKNIKWHIMLLSIKKIKSCSVNST